MFTLFKKRKFWYIAIPIILVVLIGVWMFVSSRKPDVEYVTEAVKNGQLIQTVTATGAVESAQEIKLNFDTAGKLIFLDAKEGQVVTAGQVLARLDSGTLSAQINQYRAGVASAQADLARIKAGASTEDVAVTQQKLTKAMSDLVSLKNEQATQRLAQRQKTVNALQGAIADQQATLYKLDRYFVDRDEQATNYSLRTDPARRLSEFEDAFYPLNRNYKTQSQVVTQLSAQTDTQIIITTADSVRLELLDFIKLLQLSLAAADAIETNIYYTQTVIDAMKADIIAQQAVVSGALTSLQTAQSALIDSIASYSTQIQAAEGAVALAEAELRLKEAGPRTFEVASAQAAVARAQAQLDQILAEVSKSTITAPINGTVTKVNFTVGEQTSMSTPVIEMLSTTQYQVKVDIAESDITKLKVGDKSKIELDAFGSDQVFFGTVTFIDPAQTTIQDVTYYKTTVSFDESSQIEQIKPGMTADVTVTTATKDNVLYVPQRAVKITQSTLDAVAEKYVEVLINGAPEKRTVSVGLRGDNGLVEILSGLNEGDQVITFVKEDTK
jgi:HlyD family secretion protein